jgi:hypothetical protein
MKKISVAVVGCGGNGSWFLREISRLIKHDQIPSSVEFTIFDHDDVAKKNLPYQDFELKEVLENKAKILGERYAMLFKQKKVTKSTELDPFDLVISAVDNKDFREMLYRYMDKRTDKYWIDLRAEGRVVAIFTMHKKNTLEKLLKTLSRESNESASCQLSYELDAGIIQLGNKIAAIIGCQYLLNYLRGEDNPPEFIHMF